MKLLIRGDKVKITKPMKEHIEGKLAKLEKYIENPENIQATILVKITDYKQKVEITIPLKEFILRAEEEQNDFYAAIDVALDKLERQIRKNKTKLARKNSKVNYDFNVDAIEDDEVEEEIITKRKKIEVKPMSEEEAVLQMELLGHQFYLFRDDETNKPAVVYKRNNGNYGIIESE